MKFTPIILGLLLTVTVAGQEFFPENTGYTFDSETLPEYIQPIQDTAREITWSIDPQSATSDGSKCFRAGKHDEDGRINKSGLQLFIIHNRSEWMGLGFTIKNPGDRSIIYRIENLIQPDDSIYSNPTHPEDSIYYRRVYSYRTVYTQEGWVREPTINLNLWGGLYGRNWQTGDTLQVSIYVVNSPGQPLNELFIDDVAYLTIPEPYRNKLHIQTHTP